MILNKMKILLIAFFTLALSMIYPIMIADAAVMCFYKSEYTSGMNKQDLPGLKYTLGASNHLMGGLCCWFWKRK